MSYLNLSGLQYFWNKIKTWLTDGKASLILGDVRLDSILSKEASTYGTLIADFSNTDPNMHTVNGNKELIAYIGWHGHPTGGMGGGSLMLRSNQGVGSKTSCHEAQFGAEGIGLGRPMEKFTGYLPPQDIRDYPTSISNLGLKIDNSDVLTKDKLSELVNFDTSKVSRAPAIVWSSAPLMIDYATTSGFDIGGNILRLLITLPMQCMIMGFCTGRVGSNTTFILIRTLNNMVTCMLMGNQVGRILEDDTSAPVTCINASYTDTKWTFVRII